MEFRIVIRNLNGLSQTSDPSRLQKAKEALGILANNDTAAFALVELGPDPNSILEELSTHLGVEWSPHFGAVRGGHIENGLLLNTRRLSATTLKLKTPPTYSTGADIKLGRQPAAVFQVNFNNKPSFILAVVHFKAEGGGLEYLIRKSLAAWLREELENFLQRAPLPVVIVGDFNGEPWEQMFGSEGFNAYRRTDVTLRSRDSLQLYNPAWKLFFDPVAGAVRYNTKTQTNIPYGTFPGGGIWHSLIDGVLVSSEWLKGKQYILHDDRLEILTHASWHHIGKQGAHHPYPKNVKAKDAELLAITDHLPIAINLEIK